MNNVSNAIVDCDFENLLELMKEVWQDEMPDNPDFIDTDWKYKFRESYAEYIKVYYKDILNDSDLDPIIKAIIDYNSIEWEEIAKYVVLSTPNLDCLIGEFEEQYEKDKWDNMSDEDKADYYRELEGDRQYDSMIDDRLQGY